MTENRYDVLFQHAQVITMEDTGPLLPDACVGVRDGRICYVGEGRETPGAHKVIDARNKILMPGFVNAHAHTAMCVMRGCADDYDLHTWLHEHIFPIEARMEEEDALAGVRLGLMESIASGITSTSDMYPFLPATLRAAAEAGVRYSMTRPMFFLGEGEYDFDKTDAALELKEAMAQGLHGYDNGRVRVDAGIHAEYSSGPQQWRDMAAFARECELVLQVHVSETKAEHEACLARHGKTPARALHDAGVFGGPAIAAHCVWTEPGDWDIFRDWGVSAVHNPVSNLKLASGVAPVAKMLKAGVNVALGTDGCCAGNTLNFFEAIKLAALLQKGTTLEPTALPAYEALKLATVNGAKAQGQEHQIGRVREGLEADLILIDLDKPHMTPCFDPVEQVVYCARPEDVCLTMVKGRILYEDGEFLTLDAEACLFDARQRSLKLVRGV